MRMEIAAQKEIISIMEDGLKDHEKHQCSCPPQFSKMCVCVCVCVCKF